MKLRLAKSAGFCFGVRRAVGLAERAAAEGPCYTLGPIIHNEREIARLEALGVHRADRVEDIPPGSTVIIRSHGISSREYRDLERQGFRLIDATCPDVFKIHKIVEAAEAEGRLPVILGSPDHPEIIAIRGCCRQAKVFETPEALEQWLGEENHRFLPITMVFQTTGAYNNLEKCNKILKKQCTNIKIFDTICNATFKRQQEAMELSDACDAMIVIGDKNSANSRRLAAICANHCPHVCFVESADELDPAVLSGADTVGITAGASAPAWIIKEVCDKMSEEIKVEGMIQEEPAVQEAEVKAAESAEESFEELLEKSIKTLYTGEKVVGVVAAITPTEISVDLGTKQSGYIPISELTDDPSAKVEDLVKIGQEIETYVMRVNDVEGTVMLSKKRLDTVKSWDDIEAARESGETVEGIVVEENKGGIIVSVKGVRVFVPASQTGLPRGTATTELMKKKVRLKITEVNQSRRRVVGSIRAVLNEERRAQAAKIWDEIEVGKHYKGVVKSLTSYGAFVDIGGIDGMVHVSELSWSRIKNPAVVVSVGDEIEVYVISFDKENKKISLGYKDRSQDPWTKFTETYEPGSVAEVKIVKLMPFGAFAEIIPGVDGLIHISQIADRRIGKPSEVLTEGETVRVKITDIDNDKKKVSLSIRALLEPVAPKPVQEETAPQEEEVVVYDTDNPPVMEEEAAPAEDAPVEEAAPAEDAE